MLEGWKTVMFNVILVIVGLADQFGIILPESFAADLNGLILSGIGIVGLVLRAVTKDVVGWKL